MKHINKLESLYHS